jgi:hypothetical protein
MFPIHIICPLPHLYKNKIPLTMLLPHPAMSRSLPKSSASLQLKIFPPGACPPFPPQTLFSHAKISLCHLLLVALPSPSLV